MKIYLAARFSRQLELRGYADKLRVQGHESTARWIEPRSSEERYEELTLAGRIRCAVDDVIDIRKSDCVISFTESPEAGYTSGGRHVELGIAVGLEKLCWIVGPHENVFHHLPHIVQFETFEDCMFGIE